MQFKRIGHKPSLKNQSHSVDEWMGTNEQPQARSRKSVAMPQNSG